MACDGEPGVVVRIQYWACDEIDEDNDADVVVGTELEQSVAVVTQIRRE